MFSNSKIVVSDLSGESLEKIYDLVNDIVAHSGKVNSDEAKLEILSEIEKTTVLVTKNQADATKSTIRSFESTTQALIQTISGLTESVESINKKINNYCKSELRSPIFSSSSGIFTALYSTGLIDEDEVSQETQILGEISLLVFDLQIAKVVCESLKVSLANYYPAQIDLCQTLESVFNCIANVRFNHEMCRQFGVRLCEFACCLRNIILRNRTSIDISNNISDFHTSVKRSLDLSGKLCNRGWLSLMITGHDGMNEFQSIDLDLTSLVEEMEQRLKQGGVGLSRAKQYIRFSIDTHDLHKHIKVLGGLESVMKSTRKLQQLAGLIRIDSQELKHELCRYFETDIQRKASSQGNWIKNHLRHAGMEIFWQKCIADKECVSRHEFNSALMDYLTKSIHLNDFEATTLLNIADQDEKKSEEEFITVPKLTTMLRNFSTDFMTCLSQYVQTTADDEKEGNGAPVIDKSDNLKRKSCIIGRKQDLDRLHDLVADETLSLCIIVHGMQGIGKTALVAQYMTSMTEINNAGGPLKKKIVCTYESASHVANEMDAVAMLLSSMTAVTVEPDGLSTRSALERRVGDVSKSLKRNGGTMICCIDDISLENVHIILKLVHEVQLMFFNSVDGAEEDENCRQYLRCMLICRDAQVVDIIRQQTKLHCIMYQVSPLLVSASLQYVEQNFPRQAMKLADDLCESFEHFPLPLELASRLPLASMYDVIISSKTRSLVSGREAGTVGDGLEAIASSVQFSNSIYSSLPRRLKVIVTALCSFPQFFDKESALLVTQFCLMSCVSKDSRMRITSSSALDTAAEVDASKIAQDVEFAVMAIECGLGTVNGPTNGTDTKLDDPENNTQKLKVWNSLHPAAESIIDALIASKVIKLHNDQIEHVWTVDQPIRSLILDQLASNDATDGFMPGVPFHAFAVSVLARLRLISKLFDTNKPITATYYFDRNRANIDVLFNETLMVIPKLVLAQCIDIFLQLSAVFQKRYHMDVLSRLHNKLIKMAESSYLSQQTFKLWSNLASIHTAMRDFPSAFFAAEKSLEQARSEKGPTSIDLLPLYVCLGRTAEAAGDVKRAIEVYIAALHVLKMNRSTVKAADILLKKFGKNKQYKEIDMEFVIMNRKLGEAYYQTGKFEEALEFCNRSIEEFESKYNFMTSTEEMNPALVRAVPELLASLIISGHSNSHFNDFSSAEQSFSRARIISKLIPNQSLEVVCQLKVDHCEAMVNIGKSVECLPVLCDCLEQLTNSNSSPSMTDKVVNMLADISMNLGQLSQARQYSVTCLSMRETQYGRNSMETLQALTRFGKLLLLTSDFLRAIPVFERLTELTSLLQGSNHHQVSAALTSLAEVFIGCNKTEEAILACQRSLRILQATDLDTMEHSEIKKLEITKSNILFLLGEAQLKAKLLPDALLSLVACEKMREKHLGEYHASVAQASYKIGSVMQRQGRLQESIAYYDKAKQIEELLTSIAAASA